jgi:CHAT domain-containing protein
MQLENTRLVMLSACETGRVLTTRSNEIQGIQQALLFAGAQSLLVSAWKVESESTSHWIADFLSPGANRYAGRGRAGREL